MQPGTEHRVAHELLADAFAHQYRYESSGRAFSAQCRFRDEQGEADATIAMTSAYDAQAVTALGVSTPRFEWLMQDLRSIARTLWGHDFEANEGRFAKLFDDSPHPMGPRITLVNDPHEATFRVRQHRITYATRREGELRHTVRIDRWHMRPDGRWLPAQFVAEIFDDAIARPLMSERYWDLFWPVGGELVPQMRRVDFTDDLGITTSRSINLAEWQIAH